MSNHCTIEKQGVWIYIDIIRSRHPCVCRGGGTSSKYIVEMQPRVVHECDKACHIIHAHSCNTRRSCNNNVIYCYPLTYCNYKLCKAQPHDLAILASSFLFSIYPRNPQTTHISHPCDPIHNTLLKETSGNIATFLPP